MTTHIFRTCPDTVIRTTSHFVLASGEVLKPWICHLDSNFDYPLIFLNTQVVSEDDGFTFVDLAITKQQALDLIGSLQAALKTFPHDS